jgi:CSLREA domain-containing protein
LVVLGAWVVTLFGLPTPASAGTLVVDTTDDRDDGRCDARHCSLREAIEAANDDPRLQSHCWVAGSTVQVSGDIAAVPVFEAPPTPLPGCWVWNPQTQQNVCTSPCPANAQPGGACTP